MSKSITLPYKGQEYTLEFTRGSVRMMEERGFVLPQLGDKGISIIPDLFAGAFIARHRFVKKELINEIFEHTTGKMELLGVLIEMYNEPLEALMSEPEESAEGNAVWAKNW